MTKFILHGGFTRVENEINDAFYAECMKDTREKVMVLLVYFAAREQNDAIESELHHRVQFAKANPQKEIHYIVATKEGFMDEVRQADVVFINGGSTNKLLSVLRTYENLEESLLGKTVAGSSAGAYALSSFGTSHDDAVIREGLGFVKIRVVCHFESLKLPPNQDAVDLLIASNTELPLVYLKDFTWQVFKV